MNFGALDSMSATVCSVQKLSFCTETASRYMDCLQSTESSVTHQSTPRLMTCCSMIRSTPQRCIHRNVEQLAHRKRARR